MQESNDWNVTAERAIWLNLLAMLLAVAAFALYLGAWSIRHGEATFEVSGGEFLVAILATLILTLAIMAGHELIHGVVVRRYGHTPVYGAELAGKVMPVFYCTAPDARFTRRQFLAVALAPAAILGPGLLLPVLLPLGGWLILPAAIHLGGCIGDFAMAWVTMRQPAGTLVEDRKSGIRFYTPLSATR